MRIAESLFWLENYLGQENRVGVCCRQIVRSITSRQSIYWLSLFSRVYISVLVNHILIFFIPRLFQGEYHIYCTHSRIFNLIFINIL